MLSGSPATSIPRIFRFGLRKLFPSAKRYIRVLFVEAGQAYTLAAIQTIHIPFATLWRFFLLHIHCYSYHHYYYCKHNYYLSSLFITIMIIFSCFSIFWHLSARVRAQMSPTTLLRIARILRAVRVLRPSAAQTIPATKTVQLCSQHLQVYLLYERG